jgi:hypothetical protein
MNEPSPEKTFIQRWTQPTLVIGLFSMIFYLIVWGVQVTTESASQGRLISVNTQAIRLLSKRYDAQAAESARTTAIQEALLRQLDVLERRMTRNEANISDNRNKVNQ